VAEAEAEAEEAVAVAVAVPARCGLELPYLSISQYGSRLPHIGVGEMSGGSRR